MNMLAHNFTASYTPARLLMTVPVYLHGSYIADSTVEVVFVRDETDRDGFSIEEMRVQNIQTDRFSCIVTEQDRDEASRDMAWEIRRSFFSNAYLPKAEDAMKEAEYEA
jgi:hypothetical protein